MPEPSITDWISAVSSIGSTAAVIVGLIFAYRQIGIWKTEARNRRCAEVAEDLIAAARNAEDVIRSLRSPMSSIPMSEIKNKAYIYEERLKRISERNSVFENLRHAQIRAKAVLSDSETDDAIEEIYRVRMDLISALDINAEYFRDPGTIEDDDQEIIKTNRKMVFGRFNESDLLHVNLTSCMDRLDRTLGPVIRLESAR